MKRWIVMLVIASTLLCRTARAEPQPADRGAEVWGWWLVAGSIFSGAALTSYALTIDCGERDIGCQQRASVGIWGGVGIAAVGSFVGLVFVERAARARRVRVSVAPTGAFVVGAF